MGVRLHKPARSENLRYLACREDLGGCQEVPKNLGQAAATPFCAVIGMRAMLTDGASETAVAANDHFAEHLRTRNRLG